MPNAAIDRTFKGTRGQKPRIASKPSTKSRGTKQDQLIRMLSAPMGAGVDMIGKKLGWQAHTTRAALSRLRKAGFEIRREQLSKGRPTRYRIIPTSNPDDRPNAA